MKKYFLLFAVGLLACAGSRKIESNDITIGSFGDLDTIYSGPVGDPLIFSVGEDGVVYSTSGILQYEGDKFPVNDKVQQFDVRVTITFPRMTLQQAAELEARVRKLFPEAQEIDFGLEKKVEAPAESFYYEMPDGVEFRILPGLTFPLQDLKNGNILKADSTGTPAWKVF